MKPISAEMKKLAHEIMPALRMMVRFPNKPVKVVSFETSIDLDKIERYIAHQGRPQRGFEEWLEKHGRVPEKEKAEVTRRNEQPPPAPRRAALLPAPATAQKLNAPAGGLRTWLQQQLAPPEVLSIISSYRLPVTPDMATAWLAFNDQNRRPSKAKIKRFAAAMAAGKWVENGETIKFSKDGRMLDGQSRLQAIILAKTAVVLEIRGDLPERAQQSMDTGEPRKGVHTLEMMGERMPGVLAPALKLLWLWERGWFAKIPFGVSAVMENGEIGVLLERHNGLKASVGWTAGPGINIRRLMPLSTAAFWHYIFGKIDADTRDAFFDGIAEGLSLTKASPVYHLREQLLDERRTKGRKTRASVIACGALMIKAWHLVVAGKSCAPGQLRWGKDDAFPALAPQGGKS